MASAEGPSWIVSEGPPAIGTRFKVLPTTNAIDWPSGDHDRPAAPSVPAISRGSSASKSRTHAWTTPSAPLAPNTTRRPSGDNSKPGSNVVAAGGKIDRLTG